MALLEPRLCVLDETDSGLDIDALKIVADGVNRLRSPERALPRHHPLPAAARLHRAGRRARAVERPHRADRRQGAGARARGQGLRGIPGRGGVRRHERRNPPDQDRGRDRRWPTTFAAAKAALPGAGGRGAARGTPSSASRRPGLPHRRVEEWKYTDLRALMRDAKPLAGAAGRRRQGARQGRRRGARRRSKARRIVFVDGAFVPELSDLAGSGAGPDHPLDGAGAGGRRSAGRRPCSASSCRPTTSAVALNTALHGRRRGDPRRARRGAGAAASICVFVNAGDTPAAVFTRSLVVVEQGARAMLIESHEGAAGSDYQVNTALELVGRRRGPCRSHQDHRRGRRRAACLER